MNFNHLLHVSTSISCSQNDVARLLGDYPTDCIRRAQFIDFDSIAAGDWDEYADFAASFCNERCGQPLVDLAYSCGSRAEGAALVYTCRVNENGMTCGRILEAVIDDGTAAENACLPPSTRCSTTCRRALQDFRDTGGCCANFTEVGSELNIDVAIDDFTLWNSCGVELTGLCTEGPLSGSGKALMAAKIPFIGLVIVVLAVLLL